MNPFHWLIKVDENETFGLPNGTIACFWALWVLLFIGMTASYATHSVAVSTFFSVLVFSDVALGALCQICAWLQETKK